MGEVSQLYRGVWKDSSEAKRFFRTVLEASAEAPAFARTIIFAQILFDLGWRRHRFAHLLHQLAACHRRLFLLFTRQFYRSGSKPMKLCCAVTYHGS